MKEIDLKDVMDEDSKKVYVALCSLRPDPILGYKFIHDARSKFWREFSPKAKKLILDTRAEEIKNLLKILSDRDKDFLIAHYKKNDFPFSSVLFYLAAKNNVVLFHCRCKYGGLATDLKEVFEIAILSMKSKLS